MKAIEYLEEKKFSYDHFTELTSTGINPDNNHIAQFAEDYHQAKLKLLGIANVVVPKGTLCNNCKSADIVPQEPQGDLICADCWSMDIT